jgi:hypothetical protein
MDDDVRRGGLRTPPRAPTPRLSKRRPFAGRPDRRRAVCCPETGSLAWRYSHNRRQYPGGTNRVRTLFTSVGNEADRVGATQPVGFTYVDSRALRALHEAPCGSGGWSSRYFPNTVELIPHRGKGCLGEGCTDPPAWASPLVIGERFACVLARHACPTCRERVPVARRLTAGRVRPVGCRLYSRKATSGRISWSMNPPCLWIAWGGVVMSPF